MSKPATLPRTSFCQACSKRCPCLCPAGVQLHRQRMCHPAGGRRQPGKRRLRARRRLRHGTWRQHHCRLHQLYVRSGNMQLSKQFHSPLLVACPSQAGQVRMLTLSRGPEAVTMARELSPWLARITTRHTSLPLSLDECSQASCGVISGGHEQEFSCWPVSQLSVVSDDAQSPCRERQTLATWLPSKHAAFMLRRCFRNAVVRAAVQRRLQCRRHEHLPVRPDDGRWLAPVAGRRGNALHQRQHEQCWRMR